ncbi:hypothetical protein ACOME3_009267 [Neoechinorhynchus agilis]
MPIQLFEVADVVFKSGQNANNRRHLALLYADKQGSGFELVQGIIERIILLSSCKEMRQSRLSTQVADNPLAMKGRCASIEIRNGEDKWHKIGLIANVNPEILAKYSIRIPCSIVEVDIRLLFDIKV